MMIDSMASSAKPSETLRLLYMAGTVLGKMGTAEDVLKHVPSIVKKKDGYEVVGKGKFSKAEW